MAEPAPNPTPNPSPNPNPGNGGGEPPVNPGVDPSKFTDKDWETIYSSENLYKHPKMAELREAQKKAKEFEQQQKLAQEEELKKQQKFDELAKMKETEANNWKTKYEESLVNNQILGEVAKKGVVDPQAALALINREGIKINTDTGAVEGIAEAVEKLVTEKPYLLPQSGGTPQPPNLGKGANPATPAGGFKYGISQFRNHGFYTANKADMDAALNAGQVDFSK